MIAATVGFCGALEFDVSHPDGTPRKPLDESRLSALGCSPRTGSREGLRRAYQDIRRDASTGTCGPTTNRGTGVGR